MQDTQLECMQVLKSLSNILLDNVPIPIGQKCSWRNSWDLDSIDSFNKQLMNTHIWALLAMSFCLPSPPTMYRFVNFWFPPLGLWYSHCHNVWNFHINFLNKHLQLELGHLQNQCILHPGRLTWNIQITHLERKMIFQTPIDYVPAVNLPLL